MSCDTIFVRKPAIRNFEAMGNVDLPLSQNLWSDNAKTVPYDLTGYTLRSSLRNIKTGVTTAATTAVITSSATVTNLTATYDKATVEGLTVNSPYIYDLSVDNASTGDSFVSMTGTIVFLQGAST